LRQPGTDVPGFFFFPAVHRVSAQNPQARQAAGLPPLSLDILFSIFLLF
jgi:hypothetical protein